MVELIRYGPRALRTAQEGPNQDHFQRGRDFISTITWMIRLQRPRCREISIFQIIKFDSVDGKRTAYDRDVGKLVDCYE